MSEGFEDKLFCCKCNQEREDVDSNDVCMDCGGVDETATQPPMLIDDSKRFPAVNRPRDSRRRQ